MIPHAAIHSARKGIQRARATLRLIRSSLREKEFRKNNRVLRDAARALNATRDATVLVRALDRVMKGNASVPRGVVATLRRKLIRSQKLAQRNAIASHAEIPRARQLLRVMRARSARWPAGVDWVVICKGAKRTYARARLEYAASRASSSNEQLHEWRKQVKYLYHQLQLLESGCARPIRKRAKQAHALSDSLGDDHDLAVLRDQVMANRVALDEGASALLTAIADRRAGRQKEALRLGAKVFCDRPRRFVRRITRHRQPRA